MGCGNSCVFGHAGMGTTGPCRCLDGLTPEKRIETRKRIATLRAERDELRERCEALEGELHEWKDVKVPAWLVENMQILQDAEAETLAALNGESAALEELAVVKGLLGDMNYCLKERIVQLKRMGVSFELPKAFARRVQDALGNK